MKTYVFFLLWFLLGLGLHLQIFPLDATVSDKWFYFPLVGLAGILGSGIQLLKVKKRLSYIMPAGAIIILLLLSIRTVVRNADWIDAKSLYIHDSKISDNFDIENNLAYEYSAEQNYQVALKHQLQAEAYYPNETFLCNIGLIRVSGHAWFVLI